MTCFKQNKNKTHWCHPTYCLFVSCYAALHLLYIPMKEGSLTFIMFILFHFKLSTRQTDRVTHCIAMNYSAVDRQFQTAVTQLACYASAADVGPTNKHHRFNVAFLLETSYFSSQQPPQLYFAGQCCQ